MSSQGAVDFLALKNKVTTGKSVHGKSMPHLYSFVLKTAGGTDPFLLNETETFVRLHSPSTRSLGAAFWEKVSADVKGSNQFPRFRHAMATSCTFMHACNHVSHVAWELTHVGRGCLFLLISGEAGLLAAEKQ